MNATAVKLGQVIETLTTIFLIVSIITTAYKLGYYQGWEEAADKVEEIADSIEERLTK